MQAGCCVDSKAAKRDGFGGLADWLADWRAEWRKEAERRGKESSAQGARTAGGKKAKRKACAPDIREIPRFAPGSLLHAC